jgi:phosphoglycerate dehydrogenase-like enzyme
MSEPIAVVLGPVASKGIVAALEALPDVGEVRTPSMEEVPGALDRSGILITYRWSDDWLDAPLDWIQSFTAGVDQFPAAALAERGIVLTSAVGIHDVQVSEHAFALLLALTRGVAESARRQLDRDWEWPRVSELEGTTMGILGLGVIGEAIARKAAAFDMRVIGTKRTPDGYSGAASQVFGPDQTVEVCRRSDVIVSVLPDTPETKQMIGEAAFAAMEDSWFISVGRGSVVDEAALVDALENGTLRGAGLDVFDTEPLPADSPLWALPNVIVTPHVAGASPRYGERLASLFARNLAAHRGEGPWVNRVEPLPPPG